MSQDLVLVYSTVRRVSCSLSLMSQVREGDGELVLVWSDVALVTGEPSSGAFGALGSVSAFLDYYKIWKWHFTVRVWWKREEGCPRGQPEFGNDTVSPASLRSQISFGQGFSYTCLNEPQQILNSEFLKCAQIYIDLFLRPSVWVMWIFGCLYCSGTTCCLISMLSRMLWRRSPLQGWLEATPPALVCSSWACGCKSKISILKPAFLWSVVKRMSSS